jgi:oligopeptide/dipeptide ABC transporter ATP-binding protein
MSQTSLEVEQLSVRIGKGEDAVTPVTGVSFAVGAGEAVGLVGESGCGKSLTLRAIVGLLPRGGAVEGTRRFALDGDTPVEYDPVRVRGRGIGMIFQEPMTALNPTMRIGHLIAEPLRARGISKRESHRRAIDLMSQVGIPDAARRARAWPHELSGGLRQRAMIAAALATEPRLLLCDEPTTALDVCIQDQILGLLSTLVRERGMSILFVTHDLAVVSQLCDRVAVMYAGELVEVGETAEVLAAPTHPYTRALLRSAPSFDGARGRLTGIPGRPPDPRAFPAGCRFAERCELAQPSCRTRVPELRSTPLVEDERLTACLRVDAAIAAAKEDRAKVLG